MAKIKLTRPELKRQRDALTRFGRYLPMLKLKQQQLQLMVREVGRECRQAAQAVEQAAAKIDSYRAVLADRAGVNVEMLSQPSEVKISAENIAGVRVPVFEAVEFPPASYSLFATSVWVDAALADLRELSGKKAERDVRQEELRLLQKELTKIVQRVNLFEKVKIPESREIIRRIRIHLGDEMTAGVGRAKIAKAKILKSEATIYGGSERSQAEMDNTTE
jgi:V/A-type H+-transporting ATPase subunit D